MIPFPWESWRDHSVKNLRVIEKQRNLREGWQNAGLMGPSREVSFARLRGIKRPAMIDMRPKKSPTEPLVRIEHEPDCSDGCFPFVQDEQLVPLSKPPHLHLVESQPGHAEIAWGIGDGLPEDVFIISHGSESSRGG